MPAPLFNGFEFKEHQVVGVNWMLQREECEYPGGLLCDEMGLGKTYQMLGTIKNSNVEETLLLCPKAVIRQWCVAAEKCGFNVFEVQGGEWTQVTPKNIDGPLLRITNYDKVPGNKSLFKGIRGRLVLDEAHRIRNPSSECYKAVSAIKRKITWVITATPLVNTIKDIRALLSLCGYDYVKLSNIEYRHSVIGEACIHRSMEEMRHVLPDLPDAATMIEEKLDFDSEEEAEFYRGVQGSIVKKFKMLEKDQSNEMFVLIMKLRQLSLHPQVYINARKREWAGYIRDDFDAPSTKFTALRKKIEAEPKATKWIVFCQFHDEMDMLMDYLNKSNSIGVIQMYHGGMTDKEKEDVLDKTLEPNEYGCHEILLLQLQSGGVGLNLQHFSKIVFMSPWWTSALMDQAIGRAVRIGQKDKVEVIMLILKEEETLNIDSMMLEKADDKRGQLQMLFSYASKGISQEEELEDQQLEDQDIENQELEDQVEEVK